ERLHEPQHRQLLLRLRLHAAHRVHRAAVDPVDRIARYVVKRALVFALVVAAGCGGDVGEPWQLDHERIVAVRATPPGIMPGEQSKLDLLIAFQAAPVEERAPDAAQVISPESLADVIEPGTWTITAPSEERLVAARAELGLPAGAPVPLTVGVGV